MSMSADSVAEDHTEQSWDLSFVQGMERDWREDLAGVTLKNTLPCK